MKETKDDTTMKKLSTEFNVTEFPFKLYDKNGNVTYHENSNGFWYRNEYDSNGKLTYHEDSTGYWYRREYDSNSNETYYENSNKCWFRKEYDSNGNVTYYEDSTRIVRGTKKQECPDTIVINGTIYTKSKNNEKAIN